MSLPTCDDAVLDVQPKSRHLVGRARPDARRMLKLANRGQRDRRGAAVVEFAVVAPLFILLLFGILEFGRMVMVQQLITNAAREGARMASTNPPDDATADQQVIDDVTSRLTGSSIPNATVTITRTTDPSTGDDRKEVAVSVPFNQVSWLPTPMFPMTPSNLVARCVMRVESVQ